MVGDNFFLDNCIKLLIYKQHREKYQIGELLKFNTVGAQYYLINATCTPFINSMILYVAL